MEKNTVIFKYKEEDGVLEMPKLTSVSGGNKIEFKPDDGIYVNDILFTTNPPVYMDVDATPTSGVAYQVEVFDLPFENMVLNFGNGTAFDLAGGSIALYFKEERSSNSFIPMVKSSPRLPNNIYNMSMYHLFEGDYGGASYSIRIIFGDVKGGTSVDSLDGFKIFIDFIETDSFF